MNKLALMAISAASLALSSGAVHAQETVDWSGFYAGVFGGYTGGNSTLLISPPAGIPVDPISASGDIGGLFGGAALGVNYQVGQGFVIGAEADIGISDIVGTGSLELAVPGFGVPVTTEVSTLASVRGRVGFAVDRFLPFATAGLAIGHVKQSINIGAAGGGGLGAFELANQTVFGWTIGAGLEYAVTEAISVKAEYRYSRFDGKETASIIMPGAGSSTTSFSTQDVRLGVNYRF
jgi:outer membrane immunogenic protein